MMMEANANNLLNNDSDRPAEGGDGAVGNNALETTLDSSRASVEGPPFLIDDPARMCLSERERQWATRIKTAIEAHDEIDSLSDFKCAQLAISCQGDVEAALMSALRLQSFRQDNDIRDTLSDSRRALSKLVKMFPNFYLSFSFNKEDGNYYFAYDNSKFSEKVFTRTEHYTTWFAAHYYMFHAWSVDFELMRKGVVVLAECGNYEWSKNNDIKVVQKVWGELLSCYPVNMQSAKHYNGGVMFNVFLSMLKRVLPAKFGSKMETGLKLDVGLDEIYLVPDAEAATVRLLNSFDAVLHWRYNLEKSFSL